MNSERDSIGISKVIGKDQKIQENISKWHSSEFALAPLSDKELEVIYQLKDHIQDEIQTNVKPKETEEADKQTQDLFGNVVDVIYTNHDYVGWITKIEKEIKVENFREYTLLFNKLEEQSSQCRYLFEDSTSAINSINTLQNEYQQVVLNTNSLHALSDQLMKHQRIVKEKRNSINEKLQNFKLFYSLSDSFEYFSKRFDSVKLIDTLDKISNCIDYLNKHPNFRESKIYLLKYENLLAKFTQFILQRFDDIIISTTKLVVNPNSNQTNLIASNLSGEEAAFSLYYGKFQSASLKIKPIIAYLESKADQRIDFEYLLSDCQKTYFTQRSTVMSAAVTCALVELKQAHEKDYSALFRSTAAFVMQLCLDEFACYSYFFTQISHHLQEYFAIMCQILYDTLRPCLISINHLEILTELCGILRKELLLNDSIVNNNELLERFAQTIKQLLQDVEERLVFRTNVYFQHDILNYHPSPGDLAYPEKLEQMEDVMVELGENRASSRASAVSLESQEVANINATGLPQFRSHTGNSPADLHGMWYPTVKRTLVCLSRLYFCLDREIFQGLAQEGLSICVHTIEKAAQEISTKKSAINGWLFQIKHLLILREQIAPFQVDFTVKEVSLDFSHVKSAAMGLLNNRDRLFSFNSNNALLEFLLEGTPKVREYLVDSRKEIDKHLKSSCEVFISHVSKLLVGNVLDWIHKVENFAKIVSARSDSAQSFSLKEQSFAKVSELTELISNTKRTIKTKLPEIQRSMQLYLANRETEFILFKPVKSNIVNCFMQVESILNTYKYTEEERIMIACPNTDQIAVFICSVSLSFEQ